MKNNPLVSVIVITYNSAKFVLETLESAKSQTYKNIELIISDDCSSDNTVELCREWLQRNKERFVRTQLITVEQNTGIPANCNRGVKAAQGEWIKFIGGDDLLMENCIEDNVDNILKNDKIFIQFSREILFRTVGENIITEIDKYFLENYNYYNYCNKEQYKTLLKKNFLIAPTSFFKKQVFNEIGSFDEEIRGIEDYPFWLKASKSGVKFYLFEKNTVMYRKSDVNFSRSPRMNLFMRKIFFKYRLKDLIKLNIFYAWDRMIYYFLIPLFFKNKYYKILYYIFSPFFFLFKREAK